MNPELTNAEWEMVLARLAEVRDGHYVDIEEGDSR